MSSTLLRVYPSELKIPCKCSRQSSVRLHGGLLRSPGLIFFLLSVPWELRWGQEAAILLHAADQQDRQVRGVQGEYPLILSWHSAVYREEGWVMDFCPVCQILRWRRRTRGSTRCGTPAAYCCRGALAASQVLFALQSYLLLNLLDTHCPSCHCYWSAGIGAVTMQAPKEMQLDYHCKDKFLVQSVVARDGATMRDFLPELVNSGNVHVDLMKTL